MTDRPRTIYGSIYCQEPSLQLSSLSIAGFKSFARPTTLQFPPGITAFVGPNGSGKSNIVDAIRWCLGEQSARDLRGQRGEDVIHAGPRRVLGYADVSLTFASDADSDASEGVSIARRLFRSGESEYLIDGERRRLRDVQETLAGLGIGNPRFVVVTQGMADFLLSATGGERRALLEQAAGLASYRQRRDEASQKLAATESNMVAAEAVLVELDPRLRSLQRQARALQARDELLERLQRRQSQWYGRQRNELNRAIREADEALAGAESERSAARDELELREREAETGMERERAWQQRLESHSSALHLARRDLDAASHEADRWQHRIAELERTRESARQRLHQFDSEIEAARKHHVGAVRDFERAGNELQRATAMRSAASIRVAELNGGVQDATKRAEVSAAALRELTKRQDATKSATGQMVAELQRLRSREIALDSAAHENETESRDLIRLEVTAVREHESASCALTAALARLGDTERRQGEQSKRYRRARELKVTVSEEARGLTVRLERTRRSIEAAEESLEGSLLRDLLIQEGMERAVDAAVSGWHSEPRRGLDDEESFMEWRDDVSARLPPSARWADDVVQVSGTIPAPLAATLIVSGAAEAMELWDRLAALPGHRIGSPPLQIVTLDGCLVSGMGVRRHANDDRGLQYLELRGQLTRLETRATRLLRYLGWLDAAEARHRIATEKADEHVVVARRDASACRDQVSAAELDMRRVSQRRQRLEAERAERDRERMGLAKDVSNLETAIAERLEHERALDDQVLRASEDSLSAGKALAAAREAHEAAVRTEREAGHDEAILSRRVEAQGDIVRLAEAEIARLMAQPEKLERELESMREALGDAQEQLSVAETRIAELRTSVSECEDRLEAERAQPPAPGPAPSDLRITRQASDAAIAAYEQAAARGAHLAAARARLEAEIERELGQDGLHDLHGGGEEPPTEDEIRRLRQRAAQYADYDVSVIGEYAELRERQAYLSSQIADLREAAAGLRDVMTVADKEMRVRFSRALNLVSAEFDRVFRLMLRGGEAMLEQTEDGGIEVCALLPGKRTRSSSSFSGGERALVTSALLFGVLRIRPAPFCVLDEVDAALDETNVDRYLDALRELSEHTQTLVVTHNRATMAAATVLYGLTMDAEGCSGLLSLRLDQYDAVS